MINVATIAASTLTFLVPYLVLGGEGFAKEMGQEAAARTVKLWDLVKSKLSGSSSQEDLEDLTKSPEDGDTQASVRRKLKKALEADPVFANKLQALVAEIDAKDGDQIRQELTVTGDGNKTILIGKGSGNTINL